MKVRSKKANANLVMVLYFAFKSLPMILAGLAIYLGYRLFVLGVTGEASIAVETTTVKGQLLNAAPGLVFGVVGLAVLGTAVWKGVIVDLGENEEDGQGGNLERRLVVNRRATSDE